MTLSETQRKIVNFWVWVSALFCKKQVVQWIIYCVNPSVNVPGWGLENKKLFCKEEISLKANM
jgi:hypothetical protein